MANQQRGLLVDFKGESWGESANAGAYTITYSAINLHPLDSACLIPQTAHMPPR
jgi:hypothetical protein